MHGSAVVFAVDREVGAAIAKHCALSQFLAAIGGVVHVQRDASRKSPDAGDVPTADELVGPVASGETAAAQRQVVGSQRANDMATIELSRAIVAVELEGVGSFVEALLVLANLVERMREGVIEVEGQAHVSALAEAEEAGIVVGAAMATDDVGIENLAKV